MFCCKRKKKSEGYSVKKNVEEDRESKPVPEAYTSIAYASKEQDPKCNPLDKPDNSTSTNEEDKSEQNLHPRQRGISQCSFYSVASVFSVANTNTDGDFYSVCSADSFKST
ncbi:unnamed protein product [Callosobruchus maculatus]|uniref:Uncharacterized protein n=1 Tax=Callosobruchus maculatus TaxID=64391 RepID=A0A653CN65_CALMS|nr:unnamed protein product [Callosobruchus maculatus]